MKTRPLSSVPASLGAVLELFLLPDGREDPMLLILNAWRVSCFSIRAVGLSTHELALAVVLFLNLCLLDSIFDVSFLI
jgi:hypothetical protein